MACCGTGRIGYERQGSGYDPHAVGHERVGRDGPPAMPEVQAAAWAAIVRFAVEHGGSADDEFPVQFDTPESGWYQWVAPDGRRAFIGWKAPGRP